MLISVTMPVERSTAMFLFASKGRSKVCVAHSAPTGQ